MLIEPLYFLLHDFELIHLCIHYRVQKHSSICLEDTENHVSFTNLHTHQFVSNNQIIHVENSLATIVRCRKFCNSFSPS